MAGEFYLSNVTGQFDWGSIIDQIIQLKSKPLQDIQKQTQQYSQQKDILSGIASSLSAFSSTISGVNIDDLFRAKKADVSDPNVISVNVSQDAPDINFSVNVNKLAQKEILVYGNGFSSLTENIGTSGTFTLRYYTSLTDYKDFTISYNSTDTLQDIVNKINSVQNYVKASVYYDGTNYKLMLSETDEANSTVETAPDLSTKAIHLVGNLPYQFGYNLLIQGAQNAQIQIGSGTPISNPSNTFSNVFSGVSITAKSVGSSNVSIQEDNSKVTDFLNSVLKAYNDVVKKVSEATGLNAPFQGNSVVRGILTDLSTLLDPLVRMGIINYNEDGTASLNTDMLSSLMNSDRNNVYNTLTRLKDALSNYLSKQSNFFNSLIGEYQSRIYSLQKRYEEISQQLAKEEESLRLEFSKVEAFMLQANNIKQRLQDFIVTLSQMQGGKG
ncbi:flagellar filament capping protein FliD [Thermocrinis minervae]|uniref:Flagellar hook-associated protein 2 n=1 Tax=Thermocrinis minervae TaxID=381751 RepID=A0A1M6QLJ9_9AQUI|nr:flagellar filament capping protein FliD [Thermocrinis minervae]SHK21058.1 flagellar hook-associated protein 2 [Thermocrinis minervae]